MAPTHEQLRHHYEVEKMLADRLRKAPSREARAKIYETMYDTLFAEVPYHSRIVPQTASDVAWRNRRKMRLMHPFLAPDRDVLEIGPGDCRFAFQMCARARRVYAADISEGSARVAGAPDNFVLLIYDGFALPLGDGTIDVAFSDQLVEHLHPDDVAWHFRMVFRALAPGGAYVIRTPHRFTGPHDISRHFVRGEAEGFHLKEWTYRDLRGALREAGFGRMEAFRSGRRNFMRAPIAAAVGVEDAIRPFPRRARAWLCRTPFPTVAVAAYKPR